MTYKAEIVDLPPSKGPSASVIEAANRSTDALIKLENSKIKASSTAREALSRSAAELSIATATSAPLTKAASSGPCASSLSNTFKAVSRTKACRLSYHELKVYKYTSGKRTYYGSAFYLFRTTLETNTSTNVVHIQNDVNMTRNSPQNSITKIGGIDFDPQPTSVYSRMSARSTPNGYNGGKTWTGYATFARKGISDGAQLTNKVFTNTATFRNPVYWAASEKRSWDTPNIQCDRQARKNIGCAVPAFIPTITIDKANNPELSRHIKAAINSGLPRTLTRTTNAKLTTANRNKACPASLKRPKGKSCDEYPFASTVEGAARYSNGTRRTFSWCSVPGKGGTGVRGWSSCMVAESRTAVKVGAFQASIHRTASPTTTSFI